MSASENTGIDIVIPDIGDSTDVEIIELLVSPGDTVVVDDSLLTLESDKASMEVPATTSGVITSITVNVGDTVNAGDIVGTLSIGDPPDSNNAKSDGDGNQDPNSEAASRTESISTPAQNAGGPAVKTDPAQAAPSPSETSVNAGPSSAEEPATVRSQGLTTSPTAHIIDESIRKAHASPGVRLYAREHGANLSLITGTGPKGRILKEDIKAFVKRSMEGMGTYTAKGAAASGGAGIPSIPEVDFSKFGEIDRVELGRIDKLSAANMHRAWLNVPMVTHHELADITDMETFRKQLKAEANEDSPRVTGLAFHMKALVQTLKAFPRLNSSLSADGEALFYKKYYHIGIAVDTPNGLVVPVFRDVDKKSILQLAEEMTDMSRRARNKKLKPAEMQGACMTISSLGGIGGTQFTPIVNPPEVAILGITKATMQPVWNGSEFKPRLMCPLDLSYDHRVVNGADAARFMAYYVQQISDVRRLTL